MLSIYRAPHGSTKRGSGVGIRALAGVGIRWGSGGDPVGIGSISSFATLQKRGIFVDEGVGIRCNRPNSVYY